MRFKPAANTVVPSRQGKCPRIDDADAVSVVLYRRLHMSAPFALAIVASGSA
jgi:hypothetical protein